MLGTSIAHYKITAKLGEGGMGAVYRATDTKLNRDVAVKVLPASFAADADRLARFTREAHVLASLNHPNIAAIYGVEQRALIMELVEGAPIKGPLPLDTALSYAKQIADALEAAHEKNVVHRDLKPANVMVTADGVIKVLDFGLAKTTERAQSADPDNSPTLTMGATEAGLIMGTAGYMAPEQAAGKSVDRRADIWAFGVVLYELLTGKTLFGGETISHTLAHVLTRDIDLSAAPASTRPLLQRCLDREPKSRLRDIGEARIAIQKLQAGPTPEEKPTVVKAKRQWIPWAVAAAAIVAAIGGWVMRPKPPEPEAIEFQIVAPGQTIRRVRFSPDGKKLAYTTNTDLFVRYLDRNDARKVEGISNIGQNFAWSPDSTRIAVRTTATNSAVMLVSIDTGAVTTLGRIPGPSRNVLSLDWGAAGYLIVEASDGRIFKFPESGGAPEPVLPLDATRGETAQRIMSFLPDGMRFLYLSISKEGPIHYIASLDGTARHRIENLRSNSVVHTRLRNGEGALARLENDQIFVRPFDAENGTFAGPEKFVATTELRTGLFTWHVADGRIALRPASARKRRFMWMGNDGARTVALESEVLGPFRLSPDQSKVVITEGRGIWTVDLIRHSKTRISSEGADATYAEWSPDNKSIAYGVDQPNGGRLFRRAADGSGQEELLFESKDRVFPASWSPDGKWLLYRSGVQGHWNLYLLPLSGERKPVRFLADSADKVAATFSPDGRWIAYASNENGRQEIFIKAVPEAAGGPKGVNGRWQVSSENGGTHPRWRADGKELFYITGAGQLMTATVESMAGAIRPGLPKVLAEGIGTGNGPTSGFDAASDGKRFLTMDGIENSDVLTVIVNWESKLKAGAAPER